MPELLTHIFRGIYYVINIIFAIYLLLPILFFLIHWLLPSGRKRLNQLPVLMDKEFHFAAIVTAHQDTRFIPPLIDSFLKQDYPHFTLYVVADDCDISNLNFSDSRICILKPSPPLHGKIHSIKYAVEHFEQQHDALIIFDSDNLVHPKYLKILNEYFKRGFKAVQTHMLSKNTDSTYAKLDSIGHIYNTFIERAVKMQLGLSSAILGLGIALDTQLYHKIFYRDSLGGFDKKLQIELIKRLPQIAFAEEAIVYDEKIESGPALEKQRTRWIFTYFKYFGEYGKLFVHGIRAFNFNKIFFAFLALRPPLFITLGIAFLLSIINIFLYPNLAICWAILIAAYILTFCLIVITQSRQKGMAKALISVPLMVVRQVLAILKISKAKKDFLKTEHGYIIYIDDVLKNDNPTWPRE